MKVERTIQLAATPEDVYRLVMDPRRLKDWVSIHRRLKDAPKGELAEGARLTQTLKVAGKRFTVRWTVVEDECPTRVVWEGRGPIGTSAKVTYGLAERDGGTSFSYCNEYELPGGGAGKLAGRAVSGVAARETERSLERLKRLVEGT